MVKVYTSYHKWKFSLTVGCVVFGAGWYWGEPWKLFSLQVLCSDADSWLFTIFSIDFLKFGIELFVTND